MQSDVRLTRVHYSSHAAHSLTRIAFTTIVLGSLIVSRPVSAQWRIGGFVGGEHESSWSEFLVVGADARLPLTSNAIEINPRVSYFIRTRTSRYQFDLNVIKPLILAQPWRIEPFVGLGAALEHVSYSGAGSTSSTNIGFNYIVGGTYKTAGSLQPFGQFQYTVINEGVNNAVVSVGVHFKLGSSIPVKPAAPPARGPVRK